MKILDKFFYNKNTLKVAQDLLGCFLVRKIGKKIIRARIIETEAYNGPDDLASHASRGRTPRNEIMFGEPGKIYIYLIYGMHYMLNIVTERKDYPAAVLIRGIEIDQPRVKPSLGGENNKNILLNGPAKLTKFLNIDKSFNNLEIYKKKNNLWIEERREVIKNSKIKKAKRIGIDYAGEYKNKLWRFFLEK